jgi:anaerobic magnesium-protoporphyrin IX monomethyl ester cyclase
LDKSEIRPPKRSARVLSGYTMLGRQIDVIETSRGCTFDCSFCSIVEMRGRNFETFSFDLGFEKEGAVFERYRAIRRAERIYV